MTSGRYPSSEEIQRYKEAGVFKHEHLQLIDANHKNVFVTEFGFQPPLTETERQLIK